VRAVGLAVLTSLTACVDEGRVWGRVTSDGVAVAGVTVRRGDARTVTDGDGGFGFDTAEEGTVDVLGLTGGAYTDLRCESPHAIALPEVVAQGTARVALLMRGVAADQPTFVAHYTSASAVGREERVAVTPVPVLAPTPLGGGGRAWAMHVDVPPADRWALGVSTLVTSGEGASVDQVLLLSGEDLRDGDVASYDLFLSDETLRGWLAWDLSGPPGAASVTLVETLALGDLPVSVTTWSGAVRQPRLVPLVQRTAATLPASIEGRFDYAAAGDCVERSVQLWADWRAAEGEDPAGTLRFRPPWPSPPQVDLRDGTVRLSGFPREEVAVVWTSSAWSGVGSGTCGAFALQPPVSSRGGALEWRAEAGGGRCALSPTWRVAPP